MDPCDNFYRHVCPADIPQKDVIPRNFLPQSVQDSLMEKARKKSSLVETALGVANMTGMLPPEYGYPLDFFKNLIFELKYADGFFDYLIKNNLLSTEFYDKLDTKMELMEGILEEQIEKTTASQMDAEMKRKFEDWSLTLRINLGLMNEGIVMPNFTKIYMLLGDLYQDLIDTQMRPADAGRLVMEMLWNFYRVDWTWFQKLGYLQAFNSYYAPKLHSLVILESALLVAKGTTDAVFWGSTGAIYGHEIQHALFKDETFEDPQLLMQRQCLHEFKTTLCDEFGDEDPQLSGGCVFYYCSCKENAQKDTYAEDVADLEGSQLAYLSMEREIGKENLKKNPYSDLDLTNQQLFFYAYGALTCVQSPGHYHDSRDVHSGMWMRTMMLAGLSQNFQEAFQCDSNSRLTRVHETALNQCNHYGESPLLMEFRK
ncbi:unnamed protein product, partial [Mesorhabditis belari]|uniref:Peptidase M13 C-terminal domain-containing protein n=1 Tax=Mesorhabditis belari TaxID=2138241 RepID=A0AAF3F4P8_9BILA